MNHESIVLNLCHFQVEASFSDEELCTCIVTLLKWIVQLHQIYRQQKPLLSEQARQLFVHSWATFPLPWRDLTDDHIKHIQLKRISGAYTNCVYAISLFDHPLLFRIYGKGLDVLFQRHDELLWMARLSQAHYGPRLYGCFRGGRFEQFLPSCTLTKMDIREPGTMRVLAVQCARTHALFQQWCKHHILSDQERQTNALWVRIKQWTRAALMAIPRLLTKHPNYIEPLNRLNLDWLQEPSLEGALKDISELEKTFQSWQSTLSFCHGDLQYGNILQLLSNASIVFVDYEYALVAPPAFDLANHFCEWMADYQSEAPHRLWEETFPSLAEQRDFLRVYLSASRDLEKQRRAKDDSVESSGSEAEWSSSDDEEDEQDESETLKSSIHASSVSPLSCTSQCMDEFDVSDETRSPKSFSKLELWRRQVMDYVSLSHLVWGLWGLVQADQSTIQGFDYWAYALQRLHFFQRRRRQLYIQS